MRILSIDIETRSDIDLPQRGVYNYVNTPYFKLLWFSYSYDYGPVQTIDMWENPVLPDFIVRDLQDPEITKCAANATFERICLSRVTGIYLDPAQWSCTLVLAGRNGLPMHLDGAAYHSKVHIQKDAGGKELINTFSIPQPISKKNPWQQWINPDHAPDKWQAYGRYNNIDVGAEMAVKQANSFLPVSQAENMLYALDQRINDRGIKIDRVFVQQAMALGAQFKAEISNRVIELTGIKNPNSVKQLITWLNEETDLEPMAKLPSKAVQKLVANLDERLDKSVGETLLLTAPSAAVGEALAKVSPEIVKEVLECRLMLGKASISKYAAMNRLAGWDDRVRGSLKFYGANRTGRWAGSGLQVQNFTKHKTKELDKLRAVVRSGVMQDVKDFHPNVPDALSQLVRTALIPSDSQHHFLISDYSAIEARVTAWLAGEQWQLDFFERGGDLYIELAARMYGIDPATIDRKTYEGALMRSRGKVSSLALGFLGGVNALKTMGDALGLEIPEHERQSIVDAFRQANPAIVDFGADLERAAIRAILTPNKYIVAGKTGKVQFVFSNSNLYMILPSGRWLTYVRAQIGTNRFGKPGIFYEGLGTARKWILLDTYGGKLLENCLTCDTEVLTKESGWIKITEVTTAHRLWDGLKWVKHDGLLDKGVQSTIRVDGVGITPEHLILTNDGWKNASQSEGYYRDKSTRANRHTLRPQRRTKVSLASPMRLRQRNRVGSFGVPEKEAKIVRLSKVRSNRYLEHETRIKQAPYVRSLAFNEGPMLKPEVPCVPQLRRQRYNRLRPLVRKFSKLLGRYVPRVRKRVVDRAHRREWELREIELHLENPKSAIAKSQKQRIRIQPVGYSYRSRGFAALRYRKFDASVPTPKLPRVSFVCAPGRDEQVYDLINAGDLHRFTVKSATGAPFIVHNCCQATARDLLAGGMLRLDHAGFKIVLHVHDEVVIEEPLNGRSIEEVNYLMCQKSAWYADLPFEAAGFVAPFYKKDDN